MSSAIANFNQCFMQDMLMKERLSYIDQLDEQSTSLSKKDQLIKEHRKENEVIATSYVCSMVETESASLTQMTH